MYVLQSFLTVQFVWSMLDGKFINQHSFLAVERNYPAVKFKLKKGAWIELSTSKMKLRYKK